ncbi:MAG TPA: S1 family peptidase [Mycobacteriales bacterium]|jgi:hypothetical protein|nr:S1 family peptidase [Mycobacteriales bacterium]
MRLRILAVCLAAAALAPILAPKSAGAIISPAGRQSRTSGAAIAGGDIFVWSSHSAKTSGSGCTVAFAVRSIRTGKRGVLTAGHCVATVPGGPSYLVHQTASAPGGDRTSPGVLLGRVTASAFRLGTDGDSAFVKLAPHVATAPLLYVGGWRSHTTIPVAGKGKLEPGTEVCYSGAATGEHCGFTVVGGSQTVSFVSAHHQKVAIGHEWRATGASCTSRRGDSGSPVYTRVGGVAYAVGILSGGQLKAGTCPFYFTPVSLALKQLGLKLVKTASAPTV